VAVFRNQSTWRAQVYIKGRCVASQAGFATKSAARDWHDKTRAERKAEPRAKPASWEELVERFETWHLPTVSARTREIYRVELRLRLTPYFQFMRLERIDEPMLEGFRAKLMAELAPSTANGTLGLLSLMLAKAVRWKMLRESPYALERIPGRLQPYPWWSEREQIGKFLEAAKARRYRAFYLTALETGLRLGELLGLAKGDIDFEHGLIHVHRQWTPRHCYGEPKHGKERWVSFDPGGELARVLRHEVEVSRHPEAVFATATGRRPIRMNVAHKYFRSVIKRAGVPTIKFHGLRHTFASWFMREVGDIWALKDILGHADIATTQRYAHHAKRQRLPALSLTARITQDSHTRADVMALTEKNDRGKEWWGYTDSKRFSGLRAA
jgi:integrase